MRFWKCVLSLFALLLLLTPRLSACPAGYESPESLVRHARLIIQVEVLSVEEAPLPAEMEARHGTDNYGRSSGKARVRVTEVIKGECAAGEFTLITGPYHTCAPYLMYHALAVGDKPVLILDAPLPPQVETVVIAWRNRLIHESINQVQKLMEYARTSWSLAVARHRRAAPEDMARAEQLHAAFVKDPALKVPVGTPYGVQACLAVLSNDPDHLPPEEKRMEEPGTQGPFLADYYKSQGAYVSGMASREVFSADMHSVESVSGSLRRPQPAEAGLFNTKLLKTILEDELSVSSALAASVLENPKLRMMWQQPQGSIVWLTLDRPAKEDRTPEMLAFYYLMLMASPEPDVFVWGSFAMDTPDQGDGFLPPDLFVGFLGGGQPRHWWGKTRPFMILASLPHPQIAPMIRALAQKGIYDHVPEVLVRYFVRLKMELDVAAAVGILEKSVEKFLQSMTKAEADPSVISFDLKRYQDKTAEALAQIGMAGEFKQAEVRLNALLQRLKGVQPPAPSR